MLPLSAAFALLLALLEFVFLCAGLESAIPKEARKLAERRRPRECGALRKKGGLTRFANFFCAFLDNGTSPSAGRVDGPASGTSGISLFTACSSALMSVGLVLWSQ